MKAGIKTIICLIALLQAVSAWSFDRAAIHAKRLGDRSQSGSLRPGAPLYSASSLDDFLISESQAPARFRQNDASLIALVGGDWLAVWTDYREGKAKLFRQRMSKSGAPTGSNVLVAGIEAGVYYVDANVQIDTLGRVYVFYRDRTNGKIYGSRYDRDLLIDLAPFVVNDDVGEAFAGPFDLAVLPDGRMVVVWENYGATGSTIAMNIYNTVGSHVQGPIQVNGSGGLTSRWVPSVAASPSGPILVAWEDYRNGSASVFARRFDGNGTAVGSDFEIVPPPHSNSNQFAPELAYTSSQDFVFGWLDQRDGQEVYFQAYDLSTGLVDTAQMISAGDNRVVNWNLDYCLSRENNLQATWASFGSSNDLNTLSFDSGVIPSLPAVAIAHPLSGSRWAPAADYGSDGRLGIAWTEVQDDDPDISFQSYDSAGSPSLLDGLILNDDAIGAPSVDPVMTRLSQTLNLVAFADQRRDDGDIYVQVIDNNGGLSGGNAIVNEDGVGNLQSEPAVATAAGKSLIVWVDSRDVGGVPGQRIFGRYADGNGVMIGSEFIVSDSLDTSVKNSPRIGMMSDGSTMVAWIGGNGIDAHVFGRRISAAGTLPEAGFGISNAAADSSVVDLCLSTDDSDRFYAFWLDRGKATPAMTAQWYSADGLSSGSYDWMPQSPGRNIDAIAVDLNSVGEAYLLWVGSDSTQGLYLSLLPHDGGVSSTLTITDNINAFPSDPAVSVDESGHVTMAWIDRRDGREFVYFQILDNLLVPVEALSPVTSALPEFMAPPSVHAEGGRTWIAWSDPRADGLNVYAATKAYLQTDVDDGAGRSMPISFGLHQNYPNPFNPSTTISFDLPSRTEVSLTVYNLLGQKVKQLVAGVQSAGAHEVEWDGTDNAGSPVASGIYLYRLTSGDFTLSRKMTLLK